MNKYQNRFQTEYFTGKREKNLYNVQFLGESNRLSLHKLTQSFATVAWFILAKWQYQKTMSELQKSVQFI